MSGYPHPRPASATTGAGQDANSFTASSSRQPARAHPYQQGAHRYDGSSLLSPSGSSAPMPSHSQSQYSMPGFQPLSQALNSSPNESSLQTSGSSPYASTAVAAAAAAAAATAAIGQSHQPQDSPPDSTNGASSSMPSGSPTKPQTRLRRACDMCSQRKVKCDESTPCRPCSDLGVDCTFARTQKRRGPPNKHAEAFRAAKIPKPEPDNVPAAHNAAEMLMSMGANGEGPPDAESIAPFPVLELLLDDYYTYIHPLIPFPHQPTFRASFVSREDKKNPEFLGLLASMMGCLVASFPRAARLHLQFQHGDRSYPRAVNFVDHCRGIALAARGHRFMEKEEVSVYDAMTSYFIGLAAGYTLRWNMCRRFMSESMSFVRELGFHRAGRISPTARALGFRGFPVNEKGFVEEEMGKRVFWVLLLGVRSMAQVGASHSEIILPVETPPEYYPERPRQVDDECITHDRILPQPDGIVSLMAGFNKGIEVYMTMQNLVGYDMHYGLTTMDWQSQMKILDDALSSVKPQTDPDNLPELLRIPLVAGPSPITSVWDQAPGFGYVAPTFPNPQPSNDIRIFWQREPGKKRLLQYEIQKTNIYTSWLATRSFYVERFLSLRDERRQAAQQTAQQAQISIYRMPPDTSHVAAATVQEIEPQPEVILGLKFEAERELIVQDLMTVLSSIPQRNMEPNGASLINKIRQVASTLLNDTFSPKGPMMQKNEAYLAHFLNILTRLEKTAPPAGSHRSHSSDEPMTAEEEEEELRCWADLRDYQEDFLRNGPYAR